jgi:UDP-glucose 4-epimerase
MGTVNLLEAATKAGVKRFVFASTIYVYSELGGFYRCSKQAGELYIEEYQKRYWLDFTILRYGSLYGPRANEGNGIHRYLTQGLQNGKIVYPGSGEEMREYIHVKDAAKLSVDILTEEYKNQHIVITGHHPMKSREMLEMIQEMVNQKISLEFSNPSNNFHYTLTPYSFIPKIGSKLVSNPYVDMGQGLLECLQEISKELDPSKVTD